MISFSPFAFMFMRSSARGAENILHAATEDKAALVSGGFYRECVIAKPETEKIEKLAKEKGMELWEYSEKLAGIQY